MAFNVAITTDGFERGTQFYSDYHDRSSQLCINTNNDVVLTDCVNTKIDKARNVIINLSGYGPMTNPKLLEVANCFVINPWNVVLNKCTSKTIEIDKKYNVLEIACNCDSLQKVIFTGSPFIATTPHVHVQKGVEFNGVVENGKLIFDTKHQYCEWKLKHQQDLTLDELLTLIKLRWAQGKREDSFKLAELAAECEGQDGKSFLAFHYMYGIGVQKDSKKGAEIYYPLALEGNLSSQYNMGLYFLRHDEPDFNENEGLKWLQRAVAQGHPLALRSIDAYHERKRINSTLQLLMNIPLDPTDTNWIEKIN